MQCFKAFGGEYLKYVEKKEENFNIKAIYTQLQTKLPKPFVTSEISTPDFYIRAGGGRGRRVSEQVLVMSAQPA